ncbi:ATP-binding protein [Ferroplasma sp.]|nr:ATP-binding protein [Ferroplasma sp.]
MQFSNIVGSRIIETLTSGIYDGNSNCIREYVQNAVDSEASKIEIQNDDGVRITIRDNGSGMDKNELQQALDFGRSPKHDKIGWRGIGIYSAIPNCKTISINTKKNGSNKKLHIDIMCDEIRKRYMDTFSIEELLAIGIPKEIEEFEDDDFKSGTEIVLNEIEPSQRTFFESNTLYRDLRIVLPLPINNKFRGNIIENLTKYNIDEPKFAIFYNNEKLFSPPFDESVFDNDSFICGIKKAKDNTNLFVYWVVTSYNNTNLNNFNSGFLFKKNQFTVGDNNTFKRFVKGSYNYWNFGEIHILDSEIKENASRNFFEINTGHAKELFESISDLLTQIQKINRIKSACDKHSNINTAVKLLEDEKITLAKQKLDSTMKILSAKKNNNVVTLPESKNYLEILDKRRTDSLHKIQELEDNMKQKDTERTDVELNKIYELLSPQFKNIAKNTQLYVAMNNYNAKNHYFTHIMEPIEKEIKNKTNNSDEEFFQMLKTIFQIDGGANIVDVKNNCQLFLIDPTKLTEGDTKKTTINYSYFLTTEFAHSLNFLYQLFINGDKHHAGVITKSLFEGKNKEELANFHLYLQYTLKFYQELIKITKKRTEINRELP